MQMWESLLQLRPFNNRTDDGAALPSNSRFIASSIFSGGDPALGWHTQPPSGLSLQRHSRESPLAGILVCGTVQMAMIRTSKTSPDEVIGSAGVETEYETGVVGV